MINWLNPNLDKELDKFIGQVKPHFVLPLCDVIAKVKINSLLIQVSEEGQEINDTFVLEREKAKDVEGLY